MNYIIRKATREDVPQIKKLIEGLAFYEKAPLEVHMERQTDLFRRFFCEGRIQKPWNRKKTDRRSNFICTAGKCQPGPVGGTRMERFGYSFLPETQCRIRQRMDFLPNEP
jgi:hypothetical protein